MIEELIPPSEMKEPLDEDLNEDEEAAGRNLNEDEGVVGDGEDPRFSTKT